MPREQNRIQKKIESVLSLNLCPGTGNTVMATFFDLFEDGRPDILSVMGNPENGFKLAAYTNTSQDSDAYFIKVRYIYGHSYNGKKMYGRSFC